MKNFLKQKWFRNMIGIFSLGLLILFALYQRKEPYAEYRYEVSGTGGSYDVNIKPVEEREKSEYADVSNGWWYSWEQKGTRWLYLSALNQNSSGTVTVKIIKDDVVVDENTSSGGYTRATVSGSY